MPKVEFNERIYSHNTNEPKSDDWVLESKAKTGLKRILEAGSRAHDEFIYWERIRHELEIIKEKQASRYFLIVSDYVNWAKDNGIAVGPGRGAGPSSLVGYALGITKIDPLRYGLPFERFLNPEREAMPDFDLDFCDERQGEIVAYLQRKYGNDCVAQLSSSSANENTYPLPTRLIITDRPVADIVPLYPIPNSSVLTTTLQVNQVSQAGVVQFNVIHQRALTVIQDTLLSLADRGIAIDIETVSLDDPQTYSFLRAGKVEGIFELGDKGYKAAIHVIQPDRFEDIAALIAMCRPDSYEKVAVYGARKRDQHLIEPVHPIYDRVTAPTYGLLLYQEQIMLIAKHAAGFAFAKGDLFRRAIKSQDSLTLNAQKADFIEGCIKSGLSSAEALAIFSVCVSRGRYCFNKSHAVAFATIAYQTAWLKANYGLVD